MAAVGLVGRLTMRIQHNNGKAKRRGMAGASKPGIPVKNDVLSVQEKHA